MILLRVFRRQRSSSALSERFQQILDEKLANSNHSLINGNPELSKALKYPASLKDVALTDTAEQKTFEQKYQREIGHVKSQSNFRNDSKIQLDLPWDGTERVLDTASRMLHDSLPRAKPSKFQDKIFTVELGLKDRIENAKEGALDYKIKPHNEKERESFRELYKERLLGPSMFVDTLSPKATLGFIGGLADSRINAAIDCLTGKFKSSDMDTVRGKPLDKARLANCLDTNFFMNEILNKQECLPPWIENQQGVEKELQRFRNELTRTLFLMMLGTLQHRCRDSDSKILRLMKDENLAICREVRQQYLRDHSTYFSEKVKDLNRGIRNYNLQCPTGALHKWKIVEEKELADRLAQLSAEFETFFQEHRKQRDHQKPPPAAPSKPFFSIWRQKGTASNAYVTSASLPSSLWDLIRSRFID